MFFTDWLYCIFIWAEYMFADIFRSSMLFCIRYGKKRLSTNIFFVSVLVNEMNTSRNLIRDMFEAGKWGWFVYLCAGWQAAAGSPCGRQPWGPAHRSADWACSAGATLSAAALCMRSADALGTGEQPRCAQAQEPDTCTCYQPDSNDTPPPAERTRDSLRNFIWFTFRIMQYLLLLIYNYIQHILPYLCNCSEMAFFLIRGTIISNKQSL